MMMELMTRDSVAYKWLQRGAHVIQSVIAILWIYILPPLLSCWHCVKTLASNFRQYFLISYLERYVQHVWDSLCSTMTIEVVSRPESFVSSTDSTCQSQQQSSTTVLPILRLNSVTMEEFLSATATLSVDDSECLNSHCRCDSQSDDCDSGLVLTDPEENEMSSDDAITSSGDNKGRHLQEPYANRRDSDSSDTSSSDGQEVDENENKEVKNRLLKQVEMMFSDDHLAKDGFLLKHVRRRSDGFVSLKLVAGLRKVKQISRDFTVVLDSLRKSANLEINHDGTKIRRVEPLTQFLKSLPVAGNKDKESKGPSSNGASSDSAQDDRTTTPKHGQSQHQSNGNQNRRNQRNNSVISNGSSSGGSRNGSFSKSSGHESMFRNAMFYTSDDAPQAIRRRGASLPMSVLNSAGGHQQYFPPQVDGQKRNSLFLSPSSSPSDGFTAPIRPKSNSYCEGSGRRNSNGGMSLWLQRRMEATKSSDGSAVICGPVRQPRGPDGTRGFASGYRNILSAM